MMALGLPRYILQQGQIWFIMLMYGKFLIVFLETDEFYEVKVSTYSLINE